MVAGSSPAGRAMYKIDDTGRCSANMLQRESLIIEVLRIIIAPLAQPGRATDS